MADERVEERGGGARAVRGACADVAHRAQDSARGVPEPTSALPLPRVPACMFLKRKAISA